MSFKSKGNTTQQQVDEELKQLLIQNYCEKFTYVEKHLLSSKQIKCIILGATINVDELVISQQKQFVIQKESVVKVVGDSKYHFNALKQ